MSDDEKHFEMYRGLSEGLMLKNVKNAESGPSANQLTCLVSFVKRYSKDLLFIYRFRSSNFGF